MKNKELEKFKRGDKVRVVIEATIDEVDNLDDDNHLNATLCFDDGDPSGGGAGDYWLPNNAIKSIEKIGDADDGS